MTRNFIIAVVVISTLTLSAATQDEPNAIGLQAAGFSSHETINQRAWQPDASISSTRDNPAATLLLSNSLRQSVQSVNQRDEAISKTIVIGFVGGFVRRDHPKHPEVQFAAYLRDRYPSEVYAEVFSNHDGQEAFRQVLRILDTDHDGTLMNQEKKAARIIIYGHSWGAAETVSLARRLEREGIPVLLTIQVDTIAKPGQSGSTIPPNVANAVNFYQSRGPLHGNPQIVAADPARTNIIGNYRMTYADRRINCDNYPWFARVFNKPHHKIENDPRVWDQAASLINSELSINGPVADGQFVLEPPPGERLASR